MFGNIVYISDNLAHIKVAEGTPVNTNLINMHVVFEDSTKKILGEVQDVGDEIIKVRFLGEVVANKFVGGVIRKPMLSAKLRIINKEELTMLVGESNGNTLYLGTSPLYDNFPIRVDINELFSNHMAIFGNSGSGKSYGVARLLQNVFLNKAVVPTKANIFVFDAYGEYHNSFQDINSINNDFNFKIYTTNMNQDKGYKLEIPIWLLGIDELAILLDAERHSQLLIIERMLKLARIFAEDNELSSRYKNHLIAKAIMNILYTNQTAASKRNDIFSIFATCTTKEFNLEAPVQGIGYVRRFRECFLIDKNGEFTESVLINDYLSGFIDESLEQHQPPKNVYFSLPDLEKALSFTLISEGLLQNEETYHEAITLKVRLHGVVNSEYAQFFDVPKYTSVDNFIASLVSVGGKKAQVVNFNLEDVEDWFAKFVTKIFSKMFFDFSKALKERASIPIHLFIEEAHRYVQNDRDVYLLGYNVFERVAKEGRKYGMVMNLISQRPVELSETVISQCSNFLIFKMNHPRDLEYIRKMLPNVSAEVVEKQKGLQPGTCVAFGKAFKVPLLIKMDLPNPEPTSSNADIIGRWQVNS